MASIKVSPGRARISAKFRLHTMGADITGAHVSEQCAIAIQDMLLAGRLAPGVLHAVALERTKQNEQWGGSEHDDGHNELDWLGFIHKQSTGIDAALESAEGAEHDSEVRERFVKIAALAVAAIESMDRKEAAR